MLRFFLVVISSFVIAIPATSQSSVTDSLVTLLNTVSDQTKKVDILNELSSAYYDNDSEKGFQYASQAYTLANAQNYPKGKRRALTLQGYYFYAAGNYAKSLNLFRQSSLVKMPDDDLLGYNYVMFGNTFRSLANYDSAQIYYNKAINLLTRVNAMDRLAYAYKNQGKLYTLQWKNQQAKESFEKALTIYQSSGSRAGIADAWFALAEVSKHISDFGEAITYTEKACELSEDLHDYVLVTQCLLSRGEIESRLGRFTEALKVYFEALGIMKSSEVPLMLATLYSDIGDVYMGLNQNDIALKYYQEALKIAERIGIKYEIAKTYSSIAWVYKNERKFDMANDYLDKSLALREEIKDEHGISQCYNARGVILHQQKKYPQAIRALEKSWEIRKRIGHQQGITSCLYNLSLVYTDMGQYATAINYQTQALALEQAIGNKYNLGFSLNRLGSLNTKLRRFPQAEAYLKQANKTALEVNSKSLLMDNYLNWSEYYEARNDKNSALLFHKRYTIMHDTIYNDVSAQKLAELQALYLVEKKDQEIAALSQDKVNNENEIKLQRSQINLQNIILASSITGLVLVSLLAFVSYSYNKRLKKAHREIMEQKEEIQAQSEELKEANATIAEINKRLEVKIEQRTLALSQAYKELDTFFYRSSHDFRRPLTTFFGLAEVAKVTVKDPSALELFDKVKETASNLDKMLIKLQSISDVGSQQLFYKEVMMREIVDTIRDSYREELERKKIKLTTELTLTQPFVSYPALIRIIIENLVENAIHFSGVVNPFIKIRTSQDGDYVVIDVQDNGQGIPPEHQEQVFEMYFRANERSKGNGLGLYIVKKAVDKLEGSISLSSIPQVGSTFTVMLPRAAPTFPRL